LSSDRSDTAFWSRLFSVSSSFSRRIASDMLGPCETSTPICLSLAMISLRLVSPLIGPP
jgi:hypothetical protein